MPKQTPVAHAVVTKPRKKILPSLLRKTKNTGSGAARLIPFNKRTTVNPPPVSKVRVDKDAEKISDLTNPLPEQPPPVSEIRKTSNSADVSSLSHGSTVNLTFANMARMYAEETAGQVGETVHQATKTAEKTANAAAKAVTDGLVLLQQQVDNPQTKVKKPTTSQEKRTMELNSGIQISAPSPITLDPVVIQKSGKQRVKLQNIEEATSPKSDAAVGELKHHLSAETDDSVVVPTTSDSQTESEVFPNTDSGSKSSSAKKLGFKKVKALLHRKHQAKNPFEESDALRAEQHYVAGIPVVAAGSVESSSPEHIPVVAAKNLPIQPQPEAVSPIARSPVAPRTQRQRGLEPDLSPARVPVDAPEFEETSVTGIPVVEGDDEENMGFKRNRMARSRWPTIHFQMAQVICTNRALSVKQMIRLKMTCSIHLATRLLTNLERTMRLTLRQWNRLQTGSLKHTV